MSTILYNGQKVTPIPSEGEGFAVIYEWIKGDVRNPENGFRRFSQNSCLQKEGDSFTADSVLDGGFVGGRLLTFYLEKMDAETYARRLRRNIRGGTDPDHIKVVQVRYYGGEGKRLDAGGVMTALCKSFKILE